MMTEKEEKSPKFCQYMLRDAIVVAKALWDCAVCAYESKYLIAKYLRTFQIYISLLNSMEVPTTMPAAEIENEKQAGRS